MSVPKELVVVEHADGSPHITVGVEREEGSREVTVQLRHYPPARRRASDGPAVVATPAFRAGFDRIDWTKAN